MGTAAAAIISVGVIGGVGQFLAGQEEARAVGAAAGAQLEAARVERAEDLALRRESREAAVAAAEPTPEELANLETATKALETDLVAREKLIASADPALIEAGRQALQLLKGQEAASLDPIRRQRQRDRERLQDNLRQRLGSGFETSTAGTQALNDFDAQTGDLLTGAQQSSLNQLLGVTQNVRQFASVTGQAQALAGIRGGVQQRRLQAIIGTPLQTGQTTSQFAGAPFVESALQARNVGTLIGNLTGSVIGGIAAGAGPAPGTSVPLTGTVGRLGNVA